MSTTKTPCPSKEGTATNLARVAAPKMVEEISAALIAAGYQAAASQLAAAKIERVSGDASGEVGYLYFQPKQNPIPRLMAPVCKTLPFSIGGFYVDLDRNGHLWGIEFLDRPDFFNELKAHGLRFG